jgi:hypothetical protein
VWSGTSVSLRDRRPDGRGPARGEQARRPYSDGVTFGGTPRPAPRWCHASTALDDFGIVTYRVDTERVRRQVPDAFVPDTFTFDDGTDGALVSAVPFIDRDFAFRFCPWVTVSCGQVNYRAYGRVGDRRGVWFFGTSLDHPFVVLPRWAWQMPWHRDRIRLTADWDGPGPAVVRLDATGGWGSAAAELRSTGHGVERLDGFRDRDETIEVLTHPMLGWYRRRRRGGLGRYSVWHPVIEAERATVSHARFAVFEDLDLVSPGTEPHSAIVQRTITFDVHTPPVRER